MAQEPGNPISELSDSEARELIRRNHIGRLAFTLRDRVDIEPISYVADDTTIYLRTSEGHKVNVLRHHPWVAFEVDEIHGPQEWQSVVVRGHIRHLEAERSPAEKAEAAAALRALRSLDSNAITANDRYPHRNQIWAIHIDQLSGRRSSSD